MVSKVLKQEKPDYLGVCFDTAAPTFRHEEYKEYKANRDEPDESLVSQFPIVDKVTEAWGLPSIRKDGFEADDIIATLARLGQKEGCDVLILSGDKDILQLVGNGIRVRDEIRHVDYDPEKVEKRYGISPDQLVDLLALMGDKVDNVLGVPGVGEKTAAKLLQASKTLEGIYSNLNGERPKLKKSLIDFKEAVFRNRGLIKLREDVPLGLKLKDLVIQPPNRETLSKFISELEFKGEFYGLDAAQVEAASTLQKNEKRKVHVVMSLNDLAGLEKAIGACQFLSYDLETTGLDKKKCDLVGISISIKENEAWYIPLGHQYLGAPQQLTWERVKGVIGKLLMSMDVMKIGHNLKFDNAIMKRFGVQVCGPQFDTMVALYCLEPDRPTYGLKKLAGDLLGEKMTEISDLIGKKNERTFESVEIEKAAAYAGADSEVTFRLYSILSERLKKEKLEPLFYKLEMPLVEVIQDMEIQGIKINTQHLHEIKKKFEKERGELQAEVFKLAGEEFLLTSPKQLSHILFEKLKLPVVKKTKTGFSTNEEVLRKLSKEHPICEKIIAFRELAKLISTYVDSLLNLADPETDRVHTSFHQTGTTTGRLSSSDPNLQNIPVRSEYGREIKKSFIASDGNIFISADYSQIDLRALAHMSGDPVLVKTFKLGGDIHTATAAEVFHVDMAKVSKEMRQAAKAINFGIVYGQQAFGLSQSLGIEFDQAKEFIEKYFERYSGVKTWIENTLETARQTKTVETLAGRRRPVPDISSSNGMVRGFAERVAMNTPIQGTSADIIKAAMVKLYHEFNIKGLKGKMLVQVHDELLFDVPQNECETIIPVIKKEMENAFQLRVPLIVDIKKGINWNDMEGLAA